ncbi:hypothetical protein T484DRAFT_2541958 [Baffinella frigidus]|nr:hypothetical protein T484DRAFT_2541958 [Cryptophyta sp. CCMP2293]
MGSLRRMLGLAVLAAFLPLSAPLLTLPSIPSSLLQRRCIGSRAGRPSSPPLRMATDPSDITSELLTRSEAIARAFAFPLAFAAAFRTGAALSVIGQPRLPRALPGPFSAVGSRVVRLPGEEGARVRLFYPCDASSTHKDAPYMTDGRATSDGMAGLVGFRQESPSTV